MEPLADILNQVLTGESSGQRAPDKAASEASILLSNWVRLYRLMMLHSLDTY